MGILHTIDRRRETRAESDLSVMIWGVDTKGDRFVQQATARQISLSGALLTGIDVELRSSDVIGVLYAGKKARYRVVWVRYCDRDAKAQAAIQRIDPDVCPWLELLAEESAVEDKPENVSSPSK